MTTAATITANLQLDAAGFQRGMKDAQSAMGDFSKRVDALGGQMQKIGGIMTLAVTLPIVAFMKSAVNSAAESEAALADLNAVLESTGGIAGVAAEQAEEYANAMQQVTKFSDEEIISAEAMLLTFTKIGKDVFPAAADATLDLAQKFKMDATQAAIMLGKALNDPIAGVTALRRVGVSLTQEQEDQIKAFMAVNDIASAQKIILDELAVEVGGVAEAFGQTFAGKMAIFNNKLDEFKETLGNAIIPSLIRLMDALTPVLEALANAPPWVVDFIVTLMGIAAVAGPITTVIGTLMRVAAFFTGAGGGGAIVTFITSTLIPAIATLGTTIWAALLPILPIIIAIIAIVAGLAFVIWAFATDFMGITTTVKQLWFIIKMAFKQGWEDIKAKTKEGLAWFNNEWKKSTTTWENNQKQWNQIQTKLFKLAMDMMSRFLNETLAKMTAKWNELKTRTTAVFNAIGSAFNRVFGGIRTLATNVINSIIAGIQRVIDAVKALIAALADIVLPDELQPGSPTPFEMGLRGISKAMDTLSRRAIPEMNLAFAPAGLREVGTGKTINIVDNRRFAAGMDAKALRTALDDRFQGFEDALFGE